MKSRLVLLEGAVLFLVVSATAAGAQTGAITGTVVSEKDDTAIDGVCVGALDAGEPHPGPSAVTTTDAAGAYALGDLAPGSYKVAFGSCECPYLWEFEFYDDQDDFESATEVAVLTNQTTPGIDAALDRGPHFDLALTRLDVEKVPLAGIETRDTFTRWKRRIHVDVTDEGAVLPEYALLFVEACPKSGEECDEWVEADVIPEPGETRTVSFDWDAFGFVGDVVITARISIDDDPQECDTDDNEAVTEHSVLLSGTGVGVRVR